MKRTKQERRVEAVDRLRQSTWANSRAKRTGSMTREEWQQRKDAELSRLEERHGIRKKA